MIGIIHFFSDFFIRLDVTKTPEKQAVKFDLNNKVDQLQESDKQKQIDVNERLRELKSSSQIQLDEKLIALKKEMTKLEEILHRELDLLYVIEQDSQLNNSQKLTQDLSELRELFAEKHAVVDRFITDIRRAADSIQLDSAATLKDKVALLNQFTDVVKQAQALNALEFDAFQNQQLKLS